MDQLNRSVFFETVVISVSAISMSFFETMHENSANSEEWTKSRVSLIAVL